MPTAEYWKRRYERAEAGRLEALDQVRHTVFQRIDTAADEQQKQIDALEKLVLNRATLHDIRREGRKILLTFVRRGEVHRLTFYSYMAFDIARHRKELLE